MGVHGSTLWLGALVLALQAGCKPDNSLNGDSGVDAGPVPTAGTTTATA